MRIIDADTHASPNMETPFSVTCDKLVFDMDKAGVDSSIVWLQPPYMREVDPSNLHIFEGVKKYPDRLHGFGWANPHLGVEKSKETIRRCIDEYGFHGVKLNGAQDFYYIDDPKMSLPLIDEIAKRGKLVAFHCGSDFFEETHPFRIGKIAKMYPETTFIMIHMGGASIPDLGDAAIEIAAENPNIMLIGSAIASRKLEKAVRVLGADRLMFGSDHPFQFMHVELARYKALFKGVISDEDFEKIMSGNVVKLLGLK